MSPRDATVQLSSRLDQLASVFAKHDFALKQHSAFLQQESLILQKMKGTGRGRSTMAPETRTLATNFHKLVNMRPAEIRRWAKDPRAKCASFPATLKRLPALADLKEKPVDQWTAKDRAFAARVVNFNTRMDGMRKKYGNTDKINVSLRNWGRAVGAPPKACPRNPKHQR